MKKYCLLFCLSFVLFLCACSEQDGHSVTKDINKGSSTENYFFSGNEIVVMLTRNKPLGNAPEYDGVLFVYADGRVEIGVANVHDIWMNNAFDESIKDYLIDHKELTILEEEQIAEICSLVQSIDLECGWEGERSDLLPCVVVVDRYSNYCVQWTESGGERLRVSTGDNQAGTYSRALDENANSALGLVLDGEYMKEWYAYINDYFRKNESWSDIE